MESKCKNRKAKIFGAVVALAVLGLSLGDALTGHGVKGNDNLNPIVAGTGSSSSSGGSSSSGSGPNAWFSKKKSYISDIVFACVDGEEIEIEVYEVKCEGFGIFVICNEGYETETRKTGNDC